MVKVRQSQIPEESGKPKFQRKNDDFFDDEDLKEYQEDEKEDDDSLPLQKLLKIEGTGICIDAIGIRTLTKEERFCDGMNPHWEYGIIFNKDIKPTVYVPVTDVSVYWANIKMRDKKYESILQALEKLGTEIISV